MHTLFLHNSLTRRKERFEPLDPQHVRMYVCGPTVYDLAHIGNARPMVVYDVLARLLRVLYPRVTYVRNITDVDDKINARAKESGEPIGAITARTTADFHADMAALGALPPDEEPRATQHIAEMMQIIERLIASGHAYAAEGHVLFAVPSFPGVRTAVGPQPGRAAGRRADRRRAVQARSGRFRAVEAVDAGSAGLGQPVGPRPAGLAHRVQRHVVALSGRDLRHPWRRHRPDLPAPRERAGAERLRLPRQPFRALLGAQRHAAGERREDVEEPRQFLHRARRAGEGAGRGGAAAAAAHALPLDARLHRCGCGGGKARAGSVLSRAGEVSGHRSSGRAAER